MKLPHRLALLGALLPICGCRSRFVVPEQPVPQNTILLSAMMRELSAQPGFTQQVLAQLEAGTAHVGKKGPALLAPHLFQELRKRLLGKDWQGLDRFPGWTMREINPTVHLADDFLGKDGSLEGISAVHPGAPPTSTPSIDGKRRSYLDLGPYPLQQEQTISLEEPSTLSGFSLEGNVTKITPTVTRGDGPNALAPEHATSQRLAYVLNRLSVNRLAGVARFGVKRPVAVMRTVQSHASSSLENDASEATTPEEVISDLTASGHTVVVTDSRYFANFGHLHYKGQDVMMPFWINTQIAVPHTGGLFHRPRPLLVPVSHAEYEWHIRGPYVNADLSHYFGVDGKAEWRTMDTLDQSWVLKRDAHTYTGAQAVEVTRLTGLITLAYMHQHARLPELAFGGYYTLGVCQDPVSAIEIRMTGRSSLFPNTVNSRLFSDPQDHEINELFAEIPKDRTGTRPPPERIFGSLPTVPGPDRDFPAVTIPGLRGDLSAAYLAWQEGHLSRTHGRMFYLALITAPFAALALLWTLFSVRQSRLQDG